MDPDPEPYGESDHRAPGPVAHDLVPGRWLDTGLLALLALLVAAPGLGSPPLLVFDESYYVVDAYAALGRGVGVGWSVHPPLGTWLVAAGAAVVDGPVGWRLASLVTGVLTVALLHRLAARLLPATTTGRLLAAAAAVLLTADGSWLVLSRTGMLDGPLTTFVVAAVAASVAAGASPTRAVRNRWLVAAGIAVGAATAVKWSGALVGPVVLVVLVLLADEEDIGRRVRTGASSALLAGLVAVGAYAAVWVPLTLADAPPVEECLPEMAPCAATGGLRGVLEHHASMVRYHTAIRAVDVGESSPAVWPLMQSPIGFFRPGCNLLSDPAEGRELPTGVERECERYPGPEADTIRYVGNPVVWIGFLVLLPFVAVGARRRDLVAATALAGWGLQWLPWLAATRVSYLWYMAPLVPFAALGVVAGARRVPAGPIVPTIVLGGIGAATGSLLALVSAPLGVAGAIIGWAAAPFVAGRGSDEDGLGAGSGALALTATLVAAAVVAAVLMRPLWVVTSDPVIDGGAAGAPVVGDADA